MNLRIEELPPLPLRFLAESKMPGQWGFVKMKVSITTPTFNMDGAIMLMDVVPDSDLMTTTRRVTRTPTLDGECELEDLGSTPADKDLNINARGLTRAEFEQLTTLVKLYPLLNIVTEQGAFSGAPERISYSDNITTLKILVKEKL